MSEHSVETRFSLCRYIEDKTLAQISRLSKNDRDEVALQVGRVAVDWLDWHSPVGVQAAGEAKAVERTSGMAACCGQCRFWKHGQTGEPGKCQCHPLYQIRWADDWCGEFKEIVKAASSAKDRLRGLPECSSHDP